MSQSNQSQIIDRQKLSVNILFGHSEEPYLIQVYDDATIHDIKKKALPPKKLLNYKLYFKGKMLDDDDSAKEIGIKNGDNLRLIENLILTSLVQDQQNESNIIKKEYALQLRINEDNMFNFDKTIERNLFFGVKELIQSDEKLDFNFQSEEYASLTPHQKIDLAYNKMIDVKNEINQHRQNNQQNKSNKQQQSNNQYSSVEQKEKLRDELYLEKWRKQVECYYLMQKELIYYILENKDEFLSVTVTDQHPINTKFPFINGIPEIISNIKYFSSSYENACQMGLQKIDQKEENRMKFIDDVTQKLEKQQISINDFEFDDYGEEFDDEEYMDGGQLLKPVLVEISQDEFDHICKNYFENLQIQNSIEQETNTSQVLPEFRKAYLLMLRTGTLNPKIFMENFMDSGNQYLEAFKNKHFSSKQVPLEKYQYDFDALNSILRFVYISQLEKMRDVQVQSANALQNDVQKKRNTMDMQLVQQSSSKLIQQSSSLSPQYSSNSLQQHSQNAMSNIIDPIQLESELLGVINLIPQHLIQFIHCNLQRYIPLFTMPIRILYLFIQQYQGTYQGAQYFKQMTLASFKQQGKQVFKAHSKMIDQIPSSDQRRTGYLYEIIFLEIPGLTIHYNVSFNSSVDVLLADIEDQVTKAQMKALDVNKLLSLLKMPQ